MQVGDTIARRFVLVRPEGADLPGVERFVARDLRLHADVTVDIVVSLAPSAVIRAAHRSRAVRDKRLARVLAAGVERVGEARTSYVVYERPFGVRLDALVGRVAFVPESAAAVVGEAAAGLIAASAQGEHHGYLSGASLTVTHRGRVVVTGVGVAGELAGQAGVGRGRSQKADAIELARLYVSAVTAMDADQVTRAALPADLPKAARTLCEQVIRGSGPKTLADVTRALGTGNTPVLLALVKEAPTLWWPTAAGGLIADVEPDVVDEVEVVEVEVDAEGVESPAADAPSTDVVVVPPLVTGPPARPKTRFGGAVDDIDEFHDIVAAQNETAAPSLLEATLERLHGRFPGSEPLARAAAAAHARAQQSAPINAAPLLLALMGVAMFVAFMFGASRLTAPFELDSDHGGRPSQTYPEYTFGVSPSSAPSADPSADPVATP